VQPLDEGGEHLVRDIGDELYVIALEGLLHDLVPGPNNDGRDSVHQDRSGRK
jgi:hypothetical protein